MSPRIAGKTVQLAVRLEAEVMDRLDTLAKRLSRPGLELSRTDAVRMAILEGLPRLEASEGLSPSRRK
jgi:predicted DNA-binding protein